MSISETIDSPSLFHMEEFLFYAIDYPKYEHAYFGGWAPLPAMSNKIHSGSAILLGGGALTKDRAGSELAYFTTLCNVKKGLEVAEVVVATLVSDYAGAIVFHHSASADEKAFDCLSSLSGITKVIDGVTYVGQGCDIGNISWLNGANSVSCSFVVCSHDQHSLFEQEVLVAINSKASLSRVLIKYAHESYVAPEVFKHKMDGVSLFACFGGLDSEDVVINCSDQSIEAIMKAINDTSARLNVNVLKAGNWKNLEELSPDYYALEQEWQRIPANWTWT